jgi:putative redox protein
MPVETTAIYRGELRCEATHIPSKNRLITDAPVDNHGKGESFSPTDLVGVALGTCMLTTMSIVAARDGIELNGSTCRVLKEMVADPLRRIGSLTVEIRMPAHLTDDQRRKLESTAKSCPVAKSVHPDVKIPVEFRYD